MAFKTTIRSRASEYPSTGRRAKLALSFSAHKSESAIQASNAELASAVVQIALGAFDPISKAFVDTPVHPVGGGGSDTDEGAKIKMAMAKALLANVSIDDAVWTKLYKAAGGRFVGDEDPADASRTLTAPVAPDVAKLDKMVLGKVKATG